MTTKRPRYDLCGSPMDVHLDTENDDTFEEAERVRKRASDAAKGMFDVIRRAATQDISTMNTLGQEGAAQAIIALLLEHRDSHDVVSSGLKAFCAITDTMRLPMIDIGESTAQIFVDAMEFDAETAAHAIFVSCVFHAGNRASLWNANVCGALRSGLRSDWTDVVRYSCEALSAYASNLEYARTIMQAQIPQTTAEALRKHKCDRHVAYAACLLLGRLGQWADYTVLICNTDAVNLIAEAIIVNAKDADTANAGCSALFWLTRSSIPATAKADLVLRSIQTAFFVHHENADVLKAATRAISRFSPAVTDQAQGLKLVNGLVSLLKRGVELESICSTIELLLCFTDKLTRTKAAKAVALCIQIENSKQEALKKIQVEAEHLLLLLKDDPGNRRPKVCELCRSSEVEIVLVDCGHACLCQECGASIQKRAYPYCPVQTCHQRVLSPLKRVFFTAATPNAGSDDGANAFLHSGTNTGVTASAYDRLSSVSLCTICYDGPAVVMWETCGHLCACTRCSESLNTGDYRKVCPVCRAKLSKAITVRFPWEELCARLSNPAGGEPNPEISSAECSGATRVTGDDANLTKAFPGGLYVAAGEHQVRDDLDDERQDVVDVYL